MPDLARDLQKRLGTPVVSSFNHPEIATLVFGYHSIVHHEYFLTKLPVVVLTNYDIPQINNHVARQLVTLAKIVFSFEFKPFLPTSVQNESKTTNDEPQPYSEDQYKVIIAAYCTGAYRLETTKAFI